jgi:nucleoside-diphosphate-sugar epimerase
MRYFVTGASGWIGSAVVPELLGAGHQVVGLARSDESAAALAAAGAEVCRGTLDDLDGLAGAAAGSDGVLHLAFKHELAFSGDFEAAATADRDAVATIGDALAGTDKPFVIASGCLGVTPGRLATEEDGGNATESPLLGESGPSMRHGTAVATVALASRGVRSSVLRLPPTVHGDGDKGFMAHIVDLAGATGVSGYVGDGSNRWPAVHRTDAARLFRLAAERAPAGSVLHGVAEEGVTGRDIATAIGTHLGLPVEPVEADHFFWLGGFLSLDSPVSSVATRRLLDWDPTGPGLLDDLGEDYYYRGTTRA